MLSFWEDWLGASQVERRPPVLVWPPVVRPSVLPAIRHCQGCWSGTFAKMFCTSLLLQGSGEAARSQSQKPGPGMNGFCLIHVDQLFISFVCGQQGMYAWTRGGLPARMRLCTNVGQGTSREPVARVFGAFAGFAGLFDFAREAAETSSGTKDSGA